MSAPNYPAPTETNPVKLNRSIRDLYDGRSNAVGTFTVTQNAATTVVSADGCNPDSRVFLQATTANAAAEVGNGTIYVSAKGYGTFTVTHANSATASRTFDYEIRG